MCQRCVRRFKNLGGSKKSSKSYGQMKALAQSFDKYGDVGLFNDKIVNVGVEAHLHKINESRTKKRYTRKCYNAEVETL